MRIDPNTLGLGALEERYGLPRGILEAQIRQESNFDPRAVSPAGAQGIAQFLPSTAKQYGIDPFDPHQSVEGMARMNAEMLKKYKGDIPKMLAAYNWGQGNLDRKGLDRAPPETRKYISSIQKGMAPRYTEGKGEFSGTLTDNKTGNVYETRTGEHIASKRKKESGFEKFMNAATNMIIPQAQAAELDDIDKEILGPDHKVPELDDIDREILGADPITAPDAPQRDLGEEALRQLGLTGRYAVEGLMALPNAVGNAANAAINLAAPGTMQPTSQATSDLLTHMGFPQSEGDAEELIGDVSRSIAGVGSSIGAAGKAAEAFPKLTTELETLMKSPHIQAGIAALGTSAGTLAKQAGWPVLMQVAATIGTSLLPAAGTGSVNMTRNVLRGGEKNIPKVLENIDAFEAAGTTPSVGQASENRLSQGFESFLHKMPGGAGPMAQKAKEQSEEIGEGVEKLASQLSPTSSAEQAGRAISKGIKEDFIPKVRTAETALYDKLDDYIPADSMIDPTNTLTTLRKLNAPIEGAKETSKALGNPALKKLLEGFETDIFGKPSVGTTAKTKIADPETGQFDFRTGKTSSPSPEAKTTFQSGEPSVPGNAKFNWLTGKIEGAKLPYQALKQIRTEIGQKLSELDLAPDIPKTQLKQAYAAITRDMEAAAKAAGPKAYASFKRANTYTKAMHERIDKLQNIIDKADPEQIFKSAMSGSEEGATKLRSLMRSLPPAGRKMLGATVLRRLGRATSGKQNELGDTFSTETFLTNWDKLSKGGARQALYDSYGPQFIQDMNKIAKVAGNLRKGSKVFQNLSGTAPAEQLMETVKGSAKNIGVLVTGLFGFFGGHPLIAAGALSEPILANQAAKFMTNPKTVRWLAKNSDKPVTALPGVIAEFQQLAKEDPDLQPMADELSRFRNTKRTK